MTEWTPGQAKRFAAQVELGKEYYTIEPSTNPWGDEPLWKSWVFDHLQPITGTPMCSGVSAVGACQRFGPMYDEKPGRHIRAMFECDDDQVYATPGDVLKVRGSRGRQKVRR